MRRRWIAAAVAVLVIAAAALAQTGLGHKVLQRIGLFERPASYTALSFANPRSLLPQLYTEQALLTLNFEVQNDSNASKHYNWSIERVRDGHSRVVSRGHLNVASEKKAQVDQLVLTSCVGGRIEFLVQLASPRESISYYTTCIAS